MLDGKAFAAEVVELVRGHVERATNPLLVRIADLEGRLANLPGGAAGKDADPLLIRTLVADAVAALPPPKDGVGVAGAMIDRGGLLVLTLSDGAVRELGNVVGRDGRDGLDGKDGPQGARGQDGIDGKDGAPGADGRDGLDGKDGPQGERGQDGIDGKDGAPGADGRDGLDGKDGAAGERGQDGIDGKDGAPGADGVGLADAVIDRDKALVITMTDGRAKSLGVVVGDDGRPGADGRDGLPGFGLEDFAAELLADGRTVELKFARGETILAHKLAFPVPVYRGVYEMSATYQLGDVVTWGGGMWHCNAETIEKPGDAAKAWTLAVKRGRDGKDALT